MKYIMFTVYSKDTTGSIAKKKIPVIFPNELNHIDISHALMPVLRKQFDSVRPTSAGFVGIDTYHIYGESESMKLESDPHDGTILNDYEHFHGIED